MAVRLLALRQLPLHHHLRGDARMVHTRLPEHVLAAHALEADQDILDRVVERVAHVQRTGDVGRRDHDRVGIGPFLRTGTGAERIRFSPFAGDLRLDGRCVIGFLKHVDEYPIDGGRRMRPE